jgi:crotonobetainyl-CoA:carnitine CoA-transferase CaiB-like acyl-CoA transferase
VLGSRDVQPLAGHLVVDFTRQLPGPYASRELMRLGARVVKVEPPEGESMQQGAPAWYQAINGGKEIVRVDLKGPGLVEAQALCDAADVILDGFRPGVFERLGLRVPDTAVYCAITGFGEEGRHALRAGHDINYMGWAGLLADTAPAVPPTQVADLAAGALGALAEILAALLERERTGQGRRIVISMTDGAHRLAAHRLGGDPVPKLLTGGPPCFQIYGTADGRYLTVGALEPKFWLRLCELIGRPDLVERHYDPSAAEELSGVFASRPLAEWLDRFDDEDVCVGPVYTLEEAAAEFGA